MDQSILFTFAFAATLAVQNFIQVSEPQFGMSPTASRCSANGLKVHREDKAAEQGIGADEVRSPTTAGPRSSIP